MPAQTLAAMRKIAAAKKTKQEKLKKIMVTPPVPLEKKVEIKSLHKVDGFHFYIEVTTASPFMDAFSDNPREYWIEKESTKERVPLADALKFGMIGNDYLPNSMYEWIHEYDKNLD